MEKQIEYVKLIFYEDRRNYDKSWGEVYYIIREDPNAVGRVKKEKITKKEYPLCLKAFRKQEGTDALPFEKYQIYDARTKKALNMPYYLKEKSLSEKTIDTIRKEMEKVGKKIYSPKEKMSSRKPKKEIDKSTLYSIKGGISDIKGNVTKKNDTKRLPIRLLCITTVTAMLGVLVNYELKKKSFSYEGFFTVTEFDNQRNILDERIQNDYLRFRKIFDKLISKDYQDLEIDDIYFFNQYIYYLAKASNDSKNHGLYYEIDYPSYLDTKGSDYEFFSLFGLYYNGIAGGNIYNKNNAYAFCAKGCNILFYKPHAIETNRSTYANNIKDIAIFNNMSPLSKIIFLNELKGVVDAIDFNYNYGDAPYWLSWDSNMSKSKLIAYIDDRIINATNDLIREIDNKVGIKR